MTHAPVRKCIAAARCDTFFNEPRPHWVDMHWRGARRPHADVRLCRHACDESRPAEAGLRSGRQLRTRRARRFFLDLDGHSPGRGNTGRAPVGRAAEENASQPALRIGRRRDAAAFRCRALSAQQRDFDGQHDLRGCRTCNRGSGRRSLADHVPQLVHGISIHPDGSAARLGCGRSKAPGCSSWRADTCRARHRGSGCRPMVWAVCAGRHASCNHRAPQSSPQQGADRSGSCPTLWEPWGAGRTGQIRRARTKDAIGSGRSTAADRPPGAPAISSTTCPVRRSSSPRR